MSLPRLLVLTDRTQCAGPLVQAVATAVDCGARAVVLREKDLPEDARRELGDQLRAVLDPVGGLLIHGGLAGGSGSEAVHLSGSDPFPAVRPRLVGRSCHSADELARAGEEGCDLVTISPVFATSSKPGYGPALGLDGLARLLPGAPRAFALGGIRPEDVPGCLGAGAYGVAVMGAVMRDPRTMRGYVSALRDLPAGEATYPT
ncbi:thiamine-phosphate pyrophosphorylase [Blastococcus aurantiacus]|uniref:Thiamine-phosphate pyrophosphorylase n=1 Tax=Blastococcus aurantiacus TaxID=1550231 RepID=A0A1G7QCJ8_9ACTN|nr:thiamine phosphate synthase [Blastococcus aurantiacus]SDF96281.1 thiamine-phosphate pyrophosphorylase [Blastococcus aurantiacus]